MLEKQVENSIKILGESLVAPGASLLLDGDIKRGGLSMVGGIAARVLIGPIGWFVVAANSYTTSVTGQSLPQYLKESFSRPGHDSGEATDAGEAQEAAG